MSNTKLGTKRWYRVLIVTPPGYPCLVVNYHEHSRGSPESTNQNLKKVCKGVHELYKQTNTKRSLLYVCI